MRDLIYCYYQSISANGLYLIYCLHFTANGLKEYNDEGMTDRDELIKVIDWCSFALLAKFQFNMKNNFYN